MQQSLNPGGTVATKATGSHTASLPQPRRQAEHSAPAKIPRRASRPQGPPRQSQPQRDVQTGRSDSGESASARPSFQDLATTGSGSATGTATPQAASAAQSRRASLRAWGPPLDPFSGGSIISPPLPPFLGGNKTATGPPDRFFIAIDTKLRLQPKRTTEITDQRLLLGSMMSLYNRQVDVKYPSMEYREASNQWWQKERQFNAWLVMDDLFNDEKWSIQLKSPTFEMGQSKNWNENARIMWRFLFRNYLIMETTQSHTYIHVSMIRGVTKSGDSLMDVDGVKKIAQCVIHFEPALQVLIPENRRDALDAMSNWIDNNNFLIKGFSRRIVIKMIEECQSTREVIELLSPNNSVSPWMDEIYFAWNFRTLYKYGAIEFRAAGTNLAPDRAYAWAELVVLFVQAAVNVPSPESLQLIPANIREFKKFLGGPDKIKNLGRIVESKRDEESVQPQIIHLQGTELEGKLQERLKSDEDLQRKLAQTYRW